jgi:hypothetical protein
MEGITLFLLSSLVTTRKIHGGSDKKHKEKVNGAIAIALDQKVNSDANCKQRRAQPQVL